MNKEEFSSKCKELVNAFASAVLDYVGKDYAAYMTDEMLLADIDLCFTKNPSAGEVMTLRRFAVRVGVSMADDMHMIEGFSKREGTLRVEDMAVTFDGILEDNHGN